nr:MAG TPA: hypothetical protein [Caudoviricetes sp.]
MRRPPTPFGQGHRPTGRRRAAPPRETGLNRWPQANA